MPGIECLIVKHDQLLMSRKDKNLSPLIGHTRQGESPLAACARSVKELTGMVVHPSCVALVFRVMPGHLSDYDLAFFAPAPKDMPEKLTSGIEWVAIPELEHNPEIAIGDRELLPQLLATDYPLAIVLEVDNTEAERSRRVLSIGPMDPASLSPLVFAELLNARRAR